MPFAIAASGSVNRRHQQREGFSLRAQIEAVPDDGKPWRETEHEPEGAASWRGHGGDTRPGHERAACAVTRDCVRTICTTYRNTAPDALQPAAVARYDAPDSHVLRDLDPAR